MTSTLKVGDHIGSLGFVVSQAGAGGVYEAALWLPSGGNVCLLANSPEGLAAVVEHYEADRARFPGTGSEQPFESTSPITSQIPDPINPPQVTTI
jgi:hypothetical protein